MQTWLAAFWFAVLVVIAVCGCEHGVFRQLPALERLVIAIDGDDVDAVRLALKENPELEPRCQAFAICKPLALAAGRGNLEIVKLLIEAGADPNGKNAYDDTAFITADHASTLSGKTDDDVRQIRRYLIEHGTDVNQPNAFALTPFMGLCGSNDLELAQLAMQYGADVNATFVPTARLSGPGPEPGGHTALMLAASEGHEKMVAWLLANGADVHQRNNRKRSALDAAIDAGHSEIIRILEEAGAKTNSK